MKKYLFPILLILLVSGGLPLLINWLILKPSLFNIVGDGTTWLLFWATYLGAFASFAMVFITWLTLKESRHQNDELISQNEKLIQQNNQQLIELKRQWEETHRPNLLFSIITHDGSYYLKIQNTGKEIASNVKVSFSVSFLDSLLFKGVANRLMQLKDPFCIEPQTSKYYYITPCKNTTYCITTVGHESYDNNEVNAWLEKHISDPIDIECTYADKYFVSESFSLQMFSSPAALLSDNATEYLGWIKKGLVFQNTHHKPIQASLESLVNTMQSLERKIAVSQDLSNKGQ